MTTSHTLTLDELDARRVLELAGRIRRTLDADAGVLDTRELDELVNLILDAEMNR